MLLLQEIPLRCNFGELPGLPYVYLQMHCHIERLSTPS